MQQAARAKPLAGGVCARRGSRLELPASAHLRGPWRWCDAHRTPILPAMEVLPSASPKPAIGVMQVPPASGVRSIGCRFGDEVAEAQGVRIAPCTPPAAEASDGDIVFCLINTCSARSVMSCSSSSRIRLLCEMGVPESDGLDSGSGDMSIPSSMVCCRPHGQQPPFFWPTHKIKGSEGAPGRGVFHKLLLSEVQTRCGRGSGE